MPVRYAEGRPETAVIDSAYGAFAGPAGCVFGGAVFAALPWLPFFT